MDQPQRSVKTMEGRREACDGIPNDDCRTVDRRWAQKLRRTDQLFGSQLRAFVVVAQFLPDIQFVFEHASPTQTTDVSGRHMVKIAYPRLSA